MYERIRVCGTHLCSGQFLKTMRVKLETHLYLNLKECQQERAKSSKYIPAMFLEISSKPLQKYFQSNPLCFYAEDIYVRYAFFDFMLEAVFGISSLTIGGQWASCLVIQIFQLRLVTRALHNGAHLNLMRTGGAANTKPAAVCAHFKHAPRLSSAPPRQLQRSRSECQIDTIINPNFNVGF